MIVAKWRPGYPNSSFFFPGKNEIVGLLFGRAAHIPPPLFLSGDGGMPILAKRDEWASVIIKRDCRPHIVKSIWGPF